MKKFFHKLRILFAQSNVKSIVEVELRVAQLQMYEAREAYEWAKMVEGFNRAKVARLTRMLDRMGE